jgi:ribonuclease VapC
MVIDSSALLAIVFGEADREQYIEIIECSLGEHRDLRVPASVLVETGIATERRNYRRELAALIDRIQPEIVPLTATIAELSVEAFRKFGKGVHKAGLNFGDCMSYATADFLKAPLLFKGDDFEQTPIRAALNKRPLA